MSSQKIHNRLERVQINTTDLETCKIISSERTKDYDLKIKQMTVTTEVYKPMYDVKGMNCLFFPALYHYARTRLKFEGKKNPCI